MPNSMAFIFFTLALSVLLSPTTVSSVASTVVAKDQASCTMCTQCENPCQPLPPPPPVIECPPPPPPPVVVCPPPPPPPVEVECPPPPAPTCIPGPCEPLPQPPPRPPCQGGPYCKPPWMTVTFPIYQLADESHAGKLKELTAFGVSVQSLISVAFLCLACYC